VLVVNHIQLCRKGPSKKELKEAQAAQEAEMLALFNAVPKKSDKNQEVKQELDPDTGPTFTDITQEIEYQRANVVAKTKITDEVFRCGILRTVQTQCKILSKIRYTSRFSDTFSRCRGHHMLVSQRARLRFNSAFAVATRRGNIATHQLK
jgi:hypothetical protein